MTDNKKPNTKPADKPKPNPAAKKPEVVMVLNQQDKVIKR